jgi:type IV pilus assembly protein PilC
MAFRYVAIAPSGEQVRGAIDVASETQAERALWDANFRVVSIRAERGLPALESLVPSLFAVKKRTLITFSRQLATLLESGVPVMRCLELLEDQAVSKPLQKAIRGISKSIRSGSTFADAVREYPQIFPPLYPRMVDLGERTGHIEEMLRQLATYMEREDAIAKRVKSALAYPSFMLVLAFAVIGILMTTALPALVEMFKEFDGELPIATRILIGTTNFTTAYRMQLLALVAAVVLGGAWSFSQPAGKRFIDRVMLTVPVFRAITINANAARFSRTLAILLRAGLPLTEIMDMVVKTTDNSVLRRAVEGVSRQLMDGAGLSGPMTQAGCYPQMLVQMVAVGEETGTLDANLDITADFYTREVDQKVDALTGMMTPLLTLVIGVIVGFIALSLIMPMYQLIGHINDAGSGAGATPPR